MTKVSLNVAIVGAGVMGLSAARALSAAGHTISLYDPAGVKAANASARAAGMLAPFAEIEHMPHSWIEAGTAGIEFWAGIAARHAIDFHHKGSLLIAHDEDLHMLERFKMHLPSGANTWNTVGREDIATLEPDLNKRFADGIYLPLEAHLNPADALDALYKDAVADGAEIITEKADITTLAKNHDAVIDCRGMAAQLDDADLRGVKGEIIILRNPEFKLARLVRLMHPRYPLYIAPRADHVFAIGATQIESADGKHVVLRSAMELLSAAYSLHASFADAQILDIAADIRPTYSNNLPRIQINDNIVRCNGLYRHGFLLAPVMADCVAAHLAGQTTEFTNLLMKENHDHHTQRAENKLPDAT